MKYLSSSNRQCVVHSHTDCYNMPYLHDEQKRAHTRQIPVFFMLQQLYYLVDSSSNSMCHIGLRVELLGDRERSEKCCHHCEME